MVVKGKTSTGFSFSVDDRIEKDVRLARVLVKANGDDDIERLNAIFEFEKLLLGNQVEKFEEHVAKKNDGYVPTEVVSNLLLEIFGALKNAKKS